MPTNLPPEYFNAEERYKEAATPQEKVARLEELISTVPKHKGTDKLRADLRKLAVQIFGLCGDWITLWLQPAHKFERLF